MLKVFKINKIPVKEMKRTSTKAKMMELVKSTVLIGHEAQMPEARGQGLDNIL